MTEDQKDLYKTGASLVLLLIGISIVVFVASHSGNVDGSTELGFGMLILVGVGFTACAIGAIINLVRLLLKIHKRK